MLTRVSLWALAALSLQLGCDDGDEEGAEPVPTGVFSISERQLDTRGCGEQAEAVEQPADCPSCLVSTPFMALLSVTWVDGAQVLMFSECADDAECPEARDRDTLDLNTTLPTREGDLWVMDYVGASTFGGCTLDRTRLTIEITDEGLELVGRWYDGGSITPPEGMDCLDYADEPPPDEQFECTRYERIVAIATGG